MVCCDDKTSFCALQNEEGTDNDKRMIRAHCYARCIKVLAHNVWFEQMMLY